MSYAAARPASRSPFPVVLAGTAASGMLLLLVNSAFTLLKETPVFWREAGGYPVALRETVLAGYYPLLGLNIFLCAAFSLLAACEYRRSARLSRWTAASGAVMWLILAANITLLTANNLENLLIGRDLHYHLPFP